jgi:hypothetical protein
MDIDVNFFEFVCDGVDNLISLFGKVCRNETTFVSKLSDTSNLKVCIGESL